MMMKSSNIFPHLSHRAGISKKLLLDYGDAVKAGATAHRIFARVKGAEKW